jgi:uncharacterized RDD family membrane protein YckC
VSDARLDTVVSAETPEGITIDLRPAGVLPRFWAFMLDFLIRGVVLIILLIPFTRMAGIGIALLFIAAFLLVWIYPVAFELSSWAGTPGKRALKLRVVMDSGVPITPAASFTRNLLLFADFLPWAFGFGTLSMFLRRDFKRLGDLAAGTLVVYQPTAPQKTAFAELEPMPPSRPLAPADQAAVIALAARAPYLTNERLDELAALAAPVSADDGRSGPQVTQRVLAVAQWLLGRRRPS